MDLEGGQTQVAKPGKTDGECFLSFGFTSGDGILYDPSSNLGEMAEWSNALVC
jgi:hypothetical protein